MNLQEPLPTEGVKVPIYATFTGWKGVPLWALGTNSVSPLLRLYVDEIEFKVLRTHRKNHTQIERIDVWQWKLTNNLIFVWNDSRLTLAANVIREDWLVQVRGFLRGRDLCLSEKALRLLEKGLDSG